MKNTLKILLTMILMLIATESFAQQKTVQKAIIKTKITCDHCKQCESCGGLLEQTLLKTKGIQMITFNEKEATIEIIYNSQKTNLPAIRTAISKFRV